MKYLIDTCVVLDTLEDRKPFSEDSNRIFKMVISGQIEGYLTACSIKDIYYVYRKYSHSNEESKKYINGLLNLFNIVDVNGADLGNALASDMNDYEDAVLAQSCLRHGIDCIITRNMKDYTNSPIKAVLPSEIK